MDTDNLLKQVAFIGEIDRQKYIQRKTKLFGSERYENDAEHSWHLAMMTLVLAAHSDKPIDVLRVLKMVLIHDLMEIDAVDTLYLRYRKKPHQFRAGTDRRKTNFRTFTRRTGNRIHCDVGRV